MPIAAAAPTDLRLIASPSEMAAGEVARQVSADGVALAVLKEMRWLEG